MPKKAIEKKSKDARLAPTNKVDKPAARKIRTPDKRSLQAYVFNNEFIKTCGIDFGSLLITNIQFRSITKEQKSYPYTESTMFNFRIQCREMLYVGRVSSRHLMEAGEAKISSSKGALLSDGSVTIHTIQYSNYFKSLNDRLVKVNMFAALLTNDLKSFLMELFVNYKYIPKLQREFWKVEYDQSAPEVVDNGKREIRSEAGKEIKEVFG